MQSRLLQLAHLLVYMINMPISAPSRVLSTEHLQVGQLFEPAGSYDEQLRAVAAPALVISGEADKLTPLSTMGARVAALLPRARSVSIPDAGHQARPAHLCMCTAGCAERQS